MFNGRWGPKVGVPLGPAWGDPDCGRGGVAACMAWTSSQAAKAEQARKDAVKSQHDRYRKPQDTPGIRVTAHRDIGVGPTPRKVELHPRDQLVMKPPTGKDYNHSKPTRLTFEDEYLQDINGAENYRQERPSYAAGRYSYLDDYGYDGVDEQSHHVGYTKDSYRQALPQAGTEPRPPNRPPWKPGGKGRVPATPTTYGDRNNKWAHLVDNTPRHVTYKDGHLYDYDVTHGRSGVLRERITRPCNSYHDRWKDEQSGFRANSRNSPEVIITSRNGHYPDDAFYTNGYAEDEAMPAEFQTRPLSAVYDRPQAQPPAKVTVTTGSQKRVAYAPSPPPPQPQSYTSRPASVRSHSRNHIRNNIRNVSDDRKIEAKQNYILQNNYKKFNTVNPESYLKYTEPAEPLDLNKYPNFYNGFVNTNNPKSSNPTSMENTGKTNHVQSAVVRTTKNKENELGDITVKVDCPEAPMASVTVRVHSARERAKTYALPKTILK